MAEFIPYKFVVIATKYIKTMKGKNRQRLRWVLQDIASQRKRQGKETFADYYVCNKDELYADKVIKTILDGENAKNA